MLNGVWGRFVKEIIREKTRICECRVTYIMCKQRSISFWLLTGDVDGEKIGRDFINKSLLDNCVSYVRIWEYIRLMDIKWHLEELCGIVDVFFADLSLLSLQEILRRLRIQMKVNIVVGWSRRGWRVDALNDRVTCVEILYGCEYW